MEPRADGKTVTVACPACRRLNRVDVQRAADRPKCGACGGAMPLDRPVEVGDGDLERVLSGSDLPVLVDFYADWCGPCKAMAPELEKLASEAVGRALVAKLDTDRNPAMAAHFGIRGIPTLIAFRGGREVGREVGAVPKQRLEALLARAQTVR